MVKGQHLSFPWVLRLFLQHFKPEEYGDDLRGILLSMETDRCYDISHRWKKKKKKEEQRMGKDAGREWKGKGTVTDQERQACSTAVSSSGPSYARPSFWVLDVPKRSTTAVRVA